MADHQVDCVQTVPLQFALNFLDCFIACKEAPCPALIMNFIFSNVSMPLNAITSIMLVFAPKRKVNGPSAAQFDTH